MSRPDKDTGRPTLGVCSLPIKVFVSSVCGQLSPTSANGVVGTLKARYPPPPTPAPSCQVAKFPPFWTFLLVLGSNPGKACSIILQHQSVTQRDMLVTHFHFLFALRTGEMSMQDPQLRVEQMP